MTPNIVLWHSITEFAIETFKLALELLHQHIILRTNLPHLTYIFVFGVMIIDAPKMP